MLLGLDLGTGSAKALLVDTSGTVHGEGTAPYPVRSPRPGWAESDPRDWWDACAVAVRAAVGGRGGRVVALGLSGQMHGVVLSDAVGSALRPAVLWADVRSADRLACYRQLDAELLRRLSNPPAAGMAGPSLLWLREAVGALGLREEIFPPLVASGRSAGTLVRQVARRLGLPAGLPVAAGAGDTAAALLGSGLLEPGPVQLTVGMGAQIFSPRESPVPDPRLRTHLYRAAHDHPSGRHYAMAAVQNAGLALEWALKVLKASWEEAYREAFSVPPGAGGVTFLPYLSGERTPHLDPNVRGVWVGLGLVHERAHLLRAAFEGVAFALREGLEALEDAGISIPELRLAGGGTLKAPWRQLLADVLGRPPRLLPPSVAPTASARGAALLAGIACGAYASVEETLLLTPETRETVLPRGGAGYEAAYARYKELYPRLRGW